MNVGLAGLGTVAARLAFRWHGSGSLDRSKQYRQNAADSLMLSREANISSSRDYWRTMAEFWFRLAQHVEEMEEARSGDPLAVRPHFQNRPLSNSN
jgi:hypothetical protein